MVILSNDGGLFALPLRKINLGVAQSLALDFHQRGFDLGVLGATERKVDRMAFADQP